MKQLMAVVYIDEVFLINFIVNLILLSVTRKIICIRSSKIMLFVGAAVGGIYASLVFMPQLHFFYTIYGKFLFSILLVGLTYGIKRIKEYLKAIGVFYLISFGFGGTCYGVVSLLQLKGDTLPLLILAASTALAYGLITLVSRHRRSKILKEDQMVGLRIEMGDKDVTIDCLVDTGNALYEPFTRRPVIIAESEQIKSLLPNGFNIESAQRSLECLQAGESPLKLRLIPFRSLGQDNGLILGFIPDKVWILHGEKQIHIKDAVIGIYEGRLSSDDRYKGLMNPELLKSIEI